MTPNNDLDIQRTANLIDGLERLHRTAEDCGNVAGLVEPPHPTTWPTVQMTATWGS